MAEDFSFSAAVEAVSTKLDGISTLKEQRITLKAFLSGKGFALILTSFDKSLVTHHGA